MTQILGPRIRRAKIRGEAVIWPAGVELKYGISSVTRWRWERSGRLPPRDFHLGDQSGWRPETLAAAEKSYA
jgi:predicted DNA-binding transcriptional regulator AlpA